MDDRHWMYTGRPSQATMTDEWIRKTNDFLEAAWSQAEGSSFLWCPCNICGNKKRKTKKVMGQHLCKYGFTPDYTRWIFHGEGHRMRDEVVRQRIDDCDADGGVGDMLHDYHEAHFGERLQEEEPEASAKAYFEMLEAAQKPLHGHTKVSQLDGIGRLMALKSQFSLSRDAFDSLLTVFGSMLPENHILPKSMYQAQKILGALKMPYEQIHSCPNGCILFRKEHEKDAYCPKCKASRFLEVDSGDGQPKKQLTIPVKILRYLPFIPRIQRLFMTEESAQQMTWHKKGVRYNPDKMVHPSDGESWKNFDRIHRDKANEARNVRIALATDGFNPYGMVAASYSCWPVFVIPLNLPPGVLFQRQSIFVSLIIPEHPGNKMSVYMEPLIDDLVKAWDEGVWTYDRATKTNFRMYVWYQFSLHDLPAYGIFCGWCTHGKFPCPTCKAALQFIWLRKGGKYSSFDKHRQFLPADHPFRQDVKNFTKGVKITEIAPPIMTGAAIHAQIDALRVNDDGGFVGYGEEHAWTQKSGLWRLPYIDDILLPHNIDVMHTEKNWGRHFLEQSWTFLIRRRTT